MYIILNILLWFINADLKLLNKKNKFNALYIYKYIITLTELSDEFKKSIINNYKKNPVWIKTFNILKNNIGENVAKILFKKENNGFI